MIIQTNCIMKVQSVFFYEKKGVMCVTENNIRFSSEELSKLYDEREKVKEKYDKAVKEREVINHRIQQAENRADYLKQKERANRTHRLCVKGGVIESLAPWSVNISERDFYDIMEAVFSLPDVQKIIDEKMRCEVDEGESNV